MLLSMQREKNIQKNYCPNCGVILTIFKFQEFSKTPRNATAINTNKSLKEILSWINDVLPSFSWLPSRSIWVHIGAVCHLAVLQSHRMFAGAASHQQQLSCEKDNILYSLYQYSLKGGLNVLQQYTPLRVRGFRIGPLLSQHVVGGD